MCTRIHGTFVIRDWHLALIQPDSELQTPTLVTNTTQVPDKHHFPSFALSPSKKISCTWSPEGLSFATCPTLEADTALGVERTSAR